MQSYNQDQVIFVVRAIYIILVQKMKDNKTLTSFELLNSSTRQHVKIFHSEKSPGILFLHLNSNMEERMIFLNLHIRNTGTKSWEESYLMLIYFDKDLYSSMKPDGKDYIF